MYIKYFYLQKLLYLLSFVKIICMNKLSATKTLHICSIGIILVILYIIFYGRFGDINVDSFREAYIPIQMLKGQVLYKNIFNIYAPLSYIINAFLFAVFGVNLNILYAAGLISTGGILFLIYKISNKFLPPVYGFVTALLIIAAGVLGTNVFNYFFPYSYGILYGILFILCSLYFGLKQKFFWAYFFYSLAICTKYEFIFLLPALIWFSRKNDVLKSIIGFIIPIIFTTGFLFIHGVNMSDISASIHWIISMTSTKTLSWFYTLSGLKFSYNLIPLYFINFAKIIAPLFILYYFKNIFVKPAVLIYFLFFTTPAILIFVFPLILILTFINYRQLNRKKLFTVLGSVLISAKVFFATLIQSYGIFFLPFALISLFILTPKNFKKPLLLIVLFLAISISTANIYDLTKKNTKVESAAGVIYIDKYYANSLNKLIDFIKQNSAETDTVIVYPEGLSLNIFSERKSDNKFYSLIPLYVETFGEEIITARLENFKPEYIIISDYDTSDYYFKSFGEDYAVNILDYINNNYNHIKTIGDKFSYRIYKRK